MTEALPVIVLLGPTASGKTALAAKLYDTFPLALISVDSAQVYCGMNIGTAKPDADFLIRYPHALIDIRLPEVAYSAADFCSDVSIAIKAAHERGKIPLLVGGSMLYFYSLFSGLADLPSADAQLRADYQQKLVQYGLTYFYQRLAEQDPTIIKRISPNDTQRILRFNELIDITGKIPSVLFSEQRTLPPTWRILALGLLPERDYLHTAIAKRFHTMIAQGFLEEVDTLRARPMLTANHPSMRSAGYRQLWAYLSGEFSLESAIEKSIIATRQLAKRQITWMRNQLNNTLDLRTFDSINPETQTTVFHQIDTFIASL